MWRAVLIVYRGLNVRLPLGRWRRKSFRHVLSDREVADAVASFRAFPALAAELTNGAARVEARVMESEQSLTSLSADVPGSFWPSPSDTQKDIINLARAGPIESIFVLWPQKNSSNGSEIPCRGWGLGMGASEGTNGATYAAVGNAPSWMWTREAPGEVWLHEWLHGVCHHFGKKGFVMPERDADGAEIHGYERDRTRGWTEYYRDLMMGNVRVGDWRVGIPQSAWNPHEPSEGARV